MNQSKYEKIGAGLPRGILLSGPPGVGKTLLGRAIAGECGVPFYFVASSTIDGMYRKLCATYISGNTSKKCG